MITLCLSDIIPTCCACLRTVARLLYEHSNMIFLHPAVLTSFRACLQVKNRLVNFFELVSSEKIAVIATCVAAGMTFASYPDSRIVNHHDIS